MKDSEREMLEVIQELVCCPAFNGQLFEHDKASHRAWTLASDVLKRYGPITPREEEEVYCERQSCPLRWPREEEEVPAFLRRQAE